jgi:hypothetical protein
MRERSGRERQDALDLGVGGDAAGQGAVAAAEGQIDMAKQPTDLLGVGIQVSADQTDLDTRGGLDISGPFFGSAVGKAGGLVGERALI